MLRRRLDVLQAHAQRVMRNADETLVKAHGTLEHGDRVLAELASAAMQALALGIETLRELQDGVTLDVYVAGRRVPVRAVLTLKEDDDDATTTETATDEQRE